MAALGAPRPHRPGALSGDDASLAQWARSALGHDFADLGLLRRALTHGSAAGRGGRSYERMEFLGDRVLGCIVAAWLYAEHDEPEGPLTRRFHRLVEGPACAAVARAIGVPERLVMETAARNDGRAQSDNVLGDAAEAIVAALFLDGGYGVAETFVRRAWGALLADGQPLLDDPKSRLQEWALSKGRAAPTYATVDREGPDHAPRFTVAVSVKGLDPVTGSGANKREAEKAAAAAMLAGIGL